MANFNQIIAGSPIIKLGGTTITYSTSAPTSPANGDLWYEPGSRYAAPWEWESSSGLWLSQPVDVLFGREANVSGVTIRRSATEFYNSQYGSGNATKLVFVNMFMQAGATAHDASNYFTFRIQYLLGTGANTDLLAIDENTGTNPSALGANGLRRINVVTNTYFPGNAWTVGYRIDKVGSTGVTLGEFSMKITLRYPRP